MATQQAFSSGLVSVALAPFQRCTPPLLQRSSRVTQAHHLPWFQPRALVIRSQGLFLMILLWFPGLFPTFACLQVPVLELHSPVFSPWSFFSPCSFSLCVVKVFYHSVTQLVCQVPGAPSPLLPSPFRVSLGVSVPYCSFALSVLLYWLCNPSFIGTAQPGSP